MEVIELSEKMHNPGRRFNVMCLCDLRQKTVSLELETAKKRCRKEVGFFSFGGGRKV
jgi:hypothetical protein